MPRSSSSSSSPTLQQKSDVSKMGKEVSHMTTLIAYLAQRQAGASSLCCWFRADLAGQSGSGCHCRACSSRRWFAPTATPPPASLTPSCTCLCRCPLPKPRPSRCRPSLWTAPVPPASMSLSFQKLVGSMGVYGFQQDLPCQITEKKQADSLLQ